MNAKTNIINQFHLLSQFAYFESLWVHHLMVQWFYCIQQSTLLYVSMPACVASSIQYCMIYNNPSISCYFDIVNWNSFSSNRGWIVPAYYVQHTHNTSYHFLLINMFPSHFIELYEIKLLKMKSVLWPLWTIGIEHK